MARKRGQWLLRLSIAGIVLTILLLSMVLMIEIEKFFAGNAAGQAAVSFRDK